MISRKVILVVFCCVVVINAENGSDSAFKAAKKLYNNCENDKEFFNCMKIQAIKLASRALKIQDIKVMDGFSLVKRSGEAESRANSILGALNENELNNFAGEKLDKILFELTRSFVDSHQVQLNIPRLMSSENTPRLVEEGRKKMKKYLGPFIAALAIKSGILTMVYHSIAIVAGKALIIGKIALVISAIIGLKKLVTPEGHEKTTYEIVKHPHIQNSHTFSSSHGDFDSHDSGQYHRSLADNADMLMQDRAYRGHFKYWFSFVCGIRNTVWKNPIPQNPLSLPIHNKENL